MIGEKSGEPSCAITLDATRLLLQGIQEVGTDKEKLRQWLADQGGLPQPNAWPRTFQQELDVCRAGLLQTIWDDRSQGWRHCIEWNAGPAPGVAALLWMDSHLTDKPEARQLMHSLLRYVTSSAFTPRAELEAGLLKKLLPGEIQGR